MAKSDLTPTPADFERARLLERLERHIYRDPMSGCWIWTGAWTAARYGTSSMNGRNVPAHRLSYVLHVGPVPDGLVLDHLCRVPACVNPSHLEPVTNRENALRGLAGVLKTHCRRGHEFNVENTAFRMGPCGNQVRRCRACAREWRRGPMKRRGKNFRELYWENPERYRAWSRASYWRAKERSAAKHKEKP